MVVRTVNLGIVSLSKLPVFQVTLFSLKCLHLSCRMGASLGEIKGLAKEVPSIPRGNFSA